MKNPKPRTSIALLSETLYRFKIISRRFYIQEVEDCWQRLRNKGLT